MECVLKTSSAEIYRSYRVGLILIGIAHPIILIITLWALYELNLFPDKSEQPSVNEIIINASLLGFVGSLLYFSRKVYLYLITQKLHRVAKDLKVVTGGGEQDCEQFKGIVHGYYLYLATRPLAGLVIGPILVMFLLAGLTTLSSVNGSEMVLSRAGIYLIYVFSRLSSS